MNKYYQKTTWENSPSTNTPINETNLNNIEEGVDELDNRVVQLDNEKSNVDWVQLQTSGDLIAEITIDGVKKRVYSKKGGGSGVTTWDELDEKPFESVGANLTVENGVLKGDVSKEEINGVIEDLTQFIDDGYLSNVHIDMNNIALNRVLGATDGSDVGSNGRCYTIDYTDVSISKKVLLKSTSATSVNVHYYDANKVWKRSDNRWVTLPYEIEVGNDIAFLRFSFNVSNSAITQAQVDALGIKLADESTPSNTELKENLTPNSYLTSGLTYTNCSYVAGGYFKIGSMVVVNIRVLASSTSRIDILGLPKYTSKTLNSKNIVSVNALNMTDGSATNYYAYIDMNGTMSVYPPIAQGKEYALSCVYLAD